MARRRNQTVARLRDALLIGFFTAAGTLINSFGVGCSLCRSGYRYTPTSCPGTRQFVTKSFGVTVAAMSWPTSVPSTSAVAAHDLRSLLSEANTAESLRYSGRRGNENRDTYANRPRAKPLVSGPTPGGLRRTPRLPPPNHALQCGSNNRALITAAGRARI